MKVVIMAGGGGTRLWPVSTEEKPKQFLSLDNERSLIQHTVDRVNSFAAPEELFITANGQYKILLKEQLETIPESHFLFEPAKRDNAAAIALTLRRLMHLGHGDDIMLMLPSDHYIENTDLFTTIVNNAHAFIVSHPEHIVTIGIRPEYPEIGFGYIEADSTIISEQLDPAVRNVRCFREKPDEKTAQEYIDKGTFFWNSGMFMWHIGNMWKLFEEFLPDIVKDITTIAEAFDSPEEDKVLQEVYPSIRAISVDFGIMEKAPHIGIIPAEGLGWSDIGNWKAVHEVLPKDASNNAIPHTVHALNASGNLVFGEGKSVHVFGVSNIGVIQTENDILIMDLGKASSIKDYLKRIT